MESKEKITFDQLPNMKNQEIFPNPVFWEFSKKYKTCPNLIKREHFTKWNSFWAWEVTTKNPYKFKTHSHSRLLLDHPHTFL